MNPIIFLKALPQNAPELIREVNPATWIERLIREGHQYKLAKQEIERQCAQDKNKLQLELQELATRKEAYLGTLKQQIRLIETENAPVMAAITAAVDELKQQSKESEQLLHKITSMIGELDADYYKVLFDSYMALKNARQQIFEQINTNLNEHTKVHTQQIESAKIQILELQRGMQKK